MLWTHCVPLTLPQYSLNSQQMTLTVLSSAVSRGGDPYSVAPAGALQQAYPEGEEASNEGQAGRSKTRRTFAPRHLDGDEDYNSADGDGKNGRKRRYRVAEVRGSWSPDEDATLMQ